MLDLIASFVGVDPLQAIIGANAAASNFLYEYNILGVSYASGNGDYAEWLEREDHLEYLTAGDIVAVKGAKITKDLKDLEQLRMDIHSAGRKAKTHNLRITSHPGPFNVLTSPHQHVVDNCVNDLTMHGDVFDMMGLTRTPYNKINIHIGGAYGDKPKAMERFCKNFELLPESVRSRLTVENDDKASMYSVKELYNGVYKRIGVPIVFDYHHHRFCDGGLSEQEALELAISTWPSDITPATHYSESRSKEQLDESIRPQAHSDYVYDKINTYGNDIDIMIEAKRKELAVARYLELHG